MSNPTHGLVEEDRISQIEVTAHNAVFLSLFLIIGISLLSLYVSTIMTNAQASSGSAFSSGNSTSGKETDVRQMGICVVGVESPCNGDSSSIDHNTR